MEIPNRNRWTEIKYEKERITIMISKKIANFAKEILVIVSYCEKIENQ